MARRILVGPVVTHVGQAGRTQLEHGLTGGGGGGHGDIEMDLGGMVGIRPARAPVVGRRIEGQARDRLGVPGDDQPVLADHVHSEHGAVEGGETLGVGRLDHDVADPGFHGPE